MQIRQRPVIPFSAPAARPAGSLPASHRVGDQVCFSGRSYRNRDLYPEQDMSNGSDGILRVYQRYKGSAQEIPWGHWGIAPRHVPLATTGLQPCRGLAIVDDTQQFLAHIYPSDNGDDILNALMTAQEDYGLDIENATISIIIGSEENDTLEGDIKDAIDEICPGKSKEIKVIQTEDENADSTGCALVNGEVFGCRYHRPTKHPVQVFEIDKS